LYGYAVHPQLLSVPTRRSSDLSGSLALVANVILVTFPGLRLCLLRLLMVPMWICRFILMLLATGWATGIRTVLGLLATGTICSIDRKSTRLNSSHVSISYADFC